MKVIESKKVEKVNGKNRASISQYTAPKKVKVIANIAKPGVGYGLQHKVA